jgi:hypothetical protein
VPTSGKKSFIFIKVFHNPIFTKMIGNEKGGKREAYPPLINFCLFFKITVNLQSINILLINFYKSSNL